MIHADEGGNMKFVSKFDEINFSCYDNFLIYTISPYCDDLCCSLGTFIEVRPILKNVDHIILDYVVRPTPFVKEFM